MAPIGGISLVTMAEHFAKHQNKNNVEEYLRFLKYRWYASKAHGGARTKLKW